jgi:hypothetical protein
MRHKAVAVWIATALLLTTGAVTSAPAGAAAGTTCANVFGTATFKPGLPKRGDQAKVKPTITIKAHAGSCKGGGVAFGDMVATLKAAVAGNCVSFGNEVGMKLAGTTKIVWNTKAVSTIAAAKLVPEPRPAFVQWRLTGKITAGKFSGATLSSSLWFSGGSCGTAPLTSAKVRRAKYLTIS